MNDFTPHVCPTCTQTTDYLLSLDRGSALIVLALYNAVRIKNENRVHIVREMICRPDEFSDDVTMALNGKMTLRMNGNASRPRYHGLTAFVDQGSGEYLITPKGAKFLRGEPVQRTAVINKITHSKKCYLEDDGFVTFRELLANDPHWAWKIDLGWTERISPIVISPQAPML